ncbi:MAG: Stp1/IreP family PP2C-type Ser/Thr phosphatase [Planctomycetota bacterium]|jgi:protein phosphatase|nr:Stp1/IreP family PP2C-type Ser/Thr phosphatase [Planctomycetota bacterium]
MKWEIAARTDVGRLRERNEDDLLVLNEKQILVVADGMGGHANGNIASRTAVSVLESWFSDSSVPDRMEEAEQAGFEIDLRDAIGAANREIFQLNQGTFSLEGMGTTVVVMRRIGCWALLATVGDSRIYRFREGKLEQLTRDHSLMEELLQQHVLSEQDVLMSPHRNIITRALGMNDSVESDTCWLKLEDGDLFLLCSDGLSDMVSAQAIQHVLMDSEDLESQSEKLVCLANERGGIDNITVVLARTTVSDS